MRADWSPIARLNVPSKLACCFLKMVVNSSPTARFKEHRRPNNTIDLVCALGEQGRRITAIPVCAFGEQRRPTALIHSNYFRAGLCASLEGYACGSHCVLIWSFQACY